MTEGDGSLPFGGEMPNGNNPKFVIKTYVALSLEHLLMLVLAWPLAFDDSARSFFLLGPWIAFGSVGVWVASWILMAIVIKRTIPRLLLLIVHDSCASCAMAYLTATEIDSGYINSVFVSFVCSFAVFIGVTLFVLHAESKFTAASGFVFGAVWCFIFWLLLSMWIGWESSYIGSLFGALVYSGSITYSISTMLMTLDQTVIETLITLHMGPFHVIRRIVKKCCHYSVIHIFLFIVSLFTLAAF